MKVQTIMLSFIAILILLSSSNAAKSRGGSATSAEGQLWLSPVNTGECTGAARITAKRTNFKDELERKYCAGAPAPLPDLDDHDLSKLQKCLEYRGRTEFPFFTNRCSDEYFIGINGKEFKLRRISRRSSGLRGVIGTFAGGGVSVEIGQPRLIKKTYIPDEPRNEDYVLDASHKVLVTVKKGALKKTFKGILRYGV